MTGPTVEYTKADEEAGWRRYQLMMSMTGIAKKVYKGLETMENATAGMNAEELKAFRDAYNVIERFNTPATWEGRCVSAFSHENEIGSRYEATSAGGMKNE